jgi:hypothetical protein
MTAAEKIKALQDFFGYTKEEARIFLIDCGEIEEGEEDDASP